MRRLIHTIVRWLNKGWQAVANRRDKVSCQEFSQILAWTISRSVLENKNKPPSSELRRFAISVCPNAQENVVTCEILFLLGFLMSQICALQIKEQDCLDELILGLYSGLVSMVRSNSEDFENVARSRYQAYLEPYGFDIERMRHQKSGTIPWKAILARLGSNLRNDFDFETDESDFVPASLALGIYFEENLKFVRKSLNTLELRNSGSR